MARWAAALRGVLPTLSGEPKRGSETGASGSGQARQTAQGDAGAARTSALQAPVVWLLGKVQSGKTSIIRAITQASDAEIGDGFRPCTSTSRLYAFPNDTPVLRFLDTRGLGEVAYDPSEDLALSEAAAHLIVATMRAADPDQGAVRDALYRVRARRPEWPIVVAQTCLHDAYPPGEGHLLPYPFEPHTSAETIARIPADLMRALAYQRTLFTDLPGDGPLLFVPIDLTRPEDGLAPYDYGLDALTEALTTAAPQGMIAAFRAMPGFATDPKARAANPIVMGHAMAAAGGDLVPIPVAGTVAATTVQARMLTRLGALYGIAWDKRAYAELMAAIGAGTLTKVAASIGLRQLAKMIPVYGQTAGAAASAAASFAVTYALGHAAVRYLHGRRVGATDNNDIAETYRQALREAFRIAKEQRLSRSEDGERR